MISISHWSKPGKLNKGINSRLRDVYRNSLSKLSNSPINPSWNTSIQMPQYRSGCTQFNCIPSIQLCVSGIVWQLILEKIRSIWQIEIADFRSINSSNWKQRLRILLTGFTLINLKVRDHGRTLLALMASRALEQQSSETRGYRIIVIGRGISFASPLHIDMSTKKCVTVRVYPLEVRVVSKHQLCPAKSSGRWISQLAGLYAWGMATARE